jgi:hypothetical protein
MTVQFDGYLTIWTLANAFMRLLLGGMNVGGL